MEQMIETVPVTASTTELSDEAKRALLEITSCCGDRADEPRIEWNDLRHQAILTEAQNILRAHQNSPQVGPAAQRMLAFMAQWDRKIREGLLDADDLTKPQYTGFAYEYHFYDPVTRRTWSASPWNAMTECLRYFYRSIEQRGRNNEEAAYQLGLSLHYFTDLTQPMHASNFANIIASGAPWDFRHKGYEDYADSERVSQLVSESRRPVSEYELIHSTPAPLVERVALISREIFYKQVKGPADQKYRDYFNIDNNWGAEAHPSYASAIPQAERLTAGFLVTWMSIAFRDVINGIYRQLLNCDVDNDYGLPTWGGKLLADPTMRNIVDAIGRTVHFQESLGPTSRDKAAGLYRRILAREPEHDDATKYWAGQIDARGFNSVLTDFINSDEYQRRFGPYVLPYAG